jgi:hypothetical protein
VSSPSLLRSLLKRRDIWQRLAVERLTEPLHLNVLALLAAAFGGTRAKIAFDVLVRQQHAYGLLHAADLARAHGARRVTVAELGVGVGTGLLNLCELSGRVERATGIGFDVVGFDTGTGMPPPVDHRDHPELYETSWFSMDSERLKARLPANARLILGDLDETIDDFVAGMSEAAPLGFATLDVDYHSSSLAALRLFTGRPELYFPYVPVYVDDLALPTHTRFAGELLAIEEFNEAHELRKLEFDRMLPYNRVFKHAEWLAHMFKLHVLDHPIRRNVAGTGRQMHVPNPYLGG